MPVGSWSVQWTHLNNKEVGKPVGHRAYSVRLRPDGHRVELGRVQPREREPSRAEERDEEVQSECGALGRSSGAGQEASESDEHRSALAKCADEEELASADFLDEEKRGEGEDGVDDREDTTEDERQTGFETDLALEQNGGVVNDAENSQISASPTGRNRMGGKGLLTRCILLVAGKAEWTRRPAPAANAAASRP